MATGRSTCIAFTLAPPAYTNKDAASWPPDLRPPVWSHWLSEQSAGKKKRSVPQFGGAKGQSFQRGTLGSIEMSEPVSASGDEGGRAVGRGLFCHAGTRGDSCGDQGSTAAIIHLLPWQCPVSQGAGVAKHKRQASIVMLRSSAAMCKWS